MKLSRDVAFYACWLIAICWISYFVIYILRHDYYQLSDNIYELNGARLAAQSWWLQDAKLIPRPGYLLNVPFYLLGFNYYALKLVSFAVEYLSFFSVIWVIDRQIFKSYLLPIGIILFSAVYAMQYQVVFDYYSAVIIFLFFGFAAYLSSLKREGRSAVAYSVVAAICWVFAAFANLALPPAFIVMVLGLALFHRRRADWLMLAVFVLGFAGLLLLYAFGVHAWLIFSHSVIRSHNSFEFTFTLYLLTFMTCIFVLLVIITLFIAFFMKGALRRRALAIWMLVCLLIYCLQFILLSCPFLSVFKWYAAMPFALSAFLAFLFFIKPNMEQDEFHRLACLFVSVGFIAFCTRFISHGLFVSFLYTPLLVFLMIWQFDKLSQSPSKVINFLLLVVLFFSIPIPQLFSYYEWQHSIYNNTVMSAQGVYVDKYTARVQSDLLKMYKKYNCQSKPFYAFYSLTADYMITKSAPFNNVTYVPNGQFEFMSKLDTNDALIDWFSKQKHWCIAIKPPFWGKLHLGRLHRFRQWVIKNSAHEIPLGRLYFQHTFVWLYVK